MISTRATHDVTLSSWQSDERTKLVSELQSEKRFPTKKNISQSAIYQGMLVAESKNTLSPNDIGMTPL